MIDVPTSSKSTTAGNFPTSDVCLDGRPLRVLVLIVLLSLVSYLALSRFVINTVIVQGRSMTPTLQDGDRYLLNRCAFLFREPRRSDLVVIRDAGPKDFAVKRIVALPGETISISDGRVSINGKTLEESYLYFGTQTYLPMRAKLELTLGVGEYFVMGDNRPTSEDSRSYGPLLRSQIMGLLLR